jgi:hypothetical protein
MRSLFGERYGLFGPDVMVPIDFVLPLLRPTTSRTDFLKINHVRDFAPMQKAGGFFD